MTAPTATDLLELKAPFLVKKWSAPLGIWLVMVVVFFWPVFYKNKVLAPLDILASLLFLAITRILQVLQSRS